MSRIVTVTFNPCIDKSTSIPAMMPEKKLRCTPPRFEPGGGGLNVARAIVKLGGEVTAIYPSGGYSGKFLDELMRREGVNTRVVSLKNHTRENLIVLDKSTNQQFRFGMPGSEVYAGEWQELLNLVKQSGAQYIVASGSLPPGIPTDIFGRLAAIARDMKARLVVDTSGEALQKAVEEGIFLFKPNLGELSSLVGKEEVSHEVVDDIAREIIARGKCEAIIVSMGPAGARLITRTDSLQVIPPVVKRQSTVGAGDSMVAGVILKLAMGKELKDAVRYGVACGTAATMNPGTELCKKDDVDRLYKIISGQHEPLVGMAQK